MDEIGNDHETMPVAEELAIIAIFIACVVVVLYWILF